MTVGAGTKSPHKEVKVPIIDRVMVALKRNGREGLSTQQLSGLIGTSTGALSVLLEKPQKQGLITRRKYGGRVFYSITTKGMENTHGNGEK